MISIDSQYKFFKTVLLTDDGAVEVIEDTGAGSPEENGGEYDAIVDITFDDNRKLNVIVDNSAYTLADIEDQYQFWDLLKIVDGKIVVTTV